MSTTAATAVDISTATEGTHAKQPGSTGTMSSNPAAADVGEGASGAAPVSGASMGVRRGTSETHGRQIAIVRQTSKKNKSIGEPQPVFAEDLNIGSMVGRSGDILVKQARLRVRINRLKKGQAPSRRSDSHKKDEKKLQLTFRMMLGVRVAVGRQSHPLDSQQVTEEAFLQVDKYVFPPAGAKGQLATPSHSLLKTFKFRDYAPKLFKMMRGLFGVSEMSYMLSVAGNYDYLELITNSKSGSFFFYSHDQKYIIKNMKRAEARFLRGILPQYYEHHRKHPDSMLIRFCGMYMVKSGGRKIPFIVMMCVEGEAKHKIHTKYDLKGSKVHRTAKEGEKVLKDNDMTRLHGKVHLGSQREAFLKIIRADAEFLRSVNVMDYSVLLSIHDTSVPAEHVDRRQFLKRSYSEFFTFADEGSGRTVPEFARIPSDQDSSVDTIPEQETTDGETTDGDASVETARSSRNGVTPAMRCRPDGGIESEGDEAKQIYWMGIIDVLQQYTGLKHAETWFKSINNKKKELSCVHPDLYCERFVTFLADHTD